MEAPLRGGKDSGKGGVQGAYTPGNAVVTDANGDLIDGGTPPGGSGTTNITVVEAPTGVEIQSSSGTNDTIAGATGTNAGVLLPADKAKLDNAPVDTNAELAGKSDTGHGHVLADISDAGTAAAQDIDDFATGAEGDLAATAVQPARTVATQHSLTGGGDLSADRTLSLVNDAASPGVNKVYGTDGSGVRGWKDDPAGGGGGAVTSVFGRTGAVTAAEADYASFYPKKLVTDTSPAALLRSVSMAEYGATHYKAPTTALVAYQTPYPFAPVDVDSTRYLTRTSNFSNAADTRRITLAATFRVDATGAQQFVFAARNKAGMSVESTGKVRIRLGNGSGSQIALFYSTTVLQPSVWYDVVFSVDIDLQNPVMLLNGRDDIDAAATVWTTSDDIDTGGATAWSVGSDALTTPANFLDGAVDRCALWLDYIDLEAHRDEFWCNGKQVDWPAAVVAGKTPLMHVKGPAAVLHRNRTGNGDFTVVGTLLDIALPAATGWWQTSGRQLYDPAGQPAALRGWRVTSNEMIGGPLTREYFRSLKAQGLAGNVLGWELWWSKGGNVSNPNPGEARPSIVGNPATGAGYQEEYLAVHLDSMANAAAEGFWIVPDFRVSYDETQAAANLAVDNDNSNGQAWQGWADHDLTISNAAVASPGTGNYRTRFFNWLTWIVGKILARRDIAPAVAYWSMWHFPFHRHGTLTDGRIDPYIDTGASGFAKLLNDHFRSLVGTGPLLGFSLYRNEIMKRIITLGEAWTPLSGNVIYICGGYGDHGTLMLDPPDTDDTFPNGDDDPDYGNPTAGEWTLVTLGNAKNIAFISNEGPGLHVNLRDDDPLGTRQQEWLEGLWNLYNRETNGWQFHALTRDVPLLNLAEGTPFGDLFRRHLLGSEPVSGVDPSSWVDAADYGLHPSAPAAVNNVALDRAIKTARETRRGLYIPGGVYLISKTFALAGHIMKTNSSGTSGENANDMFVVYDGVWFQVAPGTAATSFHECKAWSYVSAGVPTSGYKSVSDLVLRNVEPWDNASEAPIVTGHVAGTSVGVKKYCVFDTRGIQGTTMIGRLHIVGNFDGTNSDNIVAIGCSQRGLAGNDGQRVTWPHLVVEDMEMGLYGTPRLGTDASTAAPDDGFADCFTAAFFPHIETRGNIGRALCIGPNKMDGSFVARATFEGTTATSRVHQTGAQFGSLRWNHKNRATTQYAACEITKSEVTVSGECYVRNNGGSPSTQGAAWFFRVGDEAALRIGALRLDNTALNATYPDLIYVGVSQNGLMACTKAHVTVFGTYDLAARADLRSVVRLQTDQSPERNRQINVTTNLAWVDADAVSIEDTGGSSTGDVLDLRTNDVRGMFRVDGGRLVHLNPNVVAKSNTRTTVDNTVTLTDILNTTIPQDAVGKTGGRIRVTLMGDCAVGGATTAAFRFKCTLGGTTEFDITTELLPGAGTANGRAWQMDIELVRRDVSTWGCHARLFISEDGTDTTGRGAFTGWLNVEGGIVARVSHAGADLSAAAAVLIVQVAPTVAEANTRVRCDNWFVEKAA